MKANYFNALNNSHLDKRKQNHFQFFDFGSHKQITKIIPNSIHNSEQYKFRCEMELKSLIHQWLNYQKQLKHQQHSLGMSKIYSSFNHQEKADHDYKDTNQQNNNQYYHGEENPLSSQLINRLYADHPIFKKINFSLADTLINIGVISLLKKNDQIPFTFYDQKHKNKCNENRKIGFILYGKLKLSDKINGYSKIIDQNDSIGQHGIQTLGINFTDFRNIKVKSETDQTAILWISKHNYEIFFKESMKCGLKEQMKKLQAQLKLSWIKKSIKRY